MVEANKELLDKSLRDMLTSPETKEAVVADCVILIDEEVSSKTGVSSIPVKTGYRLVRSLKPGFVALATEHLLPDFADAVEPYWKEALSREKPVQEFMARGDDAAEALLGVTDARINQASAPVKGAYSRLRATAKRHVEAAIPRLAELLNKHASGPRS